MNQPINFRTLRALFLWLMVLPLLLVVDAYSATLYLMNGAADPVEIYITQPDDKTLRIPLQPAAFLELKLADGFIGVDSSIMSSGFSGVYLVPEQVMVLRQTPFNGLETFTIPSPVATSSSDQTHNLFLCLTAGFFFAYYFFSPLE